MGKVLKGQEGSKAVGQGKATQSRPREVLFGDAWLGSRGMDGMGSVVIGVIWYGSHGWVVCGRFGSGEV